MAATSPSVDSDVESPPASPHSSSSFAADIPSAGAASSLEPPTPGVRSASVSGTTTGMTSSSTPLGNLNAARRPGPPPPSLNSRGSGLNVSQDLLARIQAVNNRSHGAPPSGMGRAGGIPSANSPASGSAHPASPSSPLVSGPGGVPASFKLPVGLTKPTVKNYASAPAVPSLRLGGAGKPSLAEKRGQILHGGNPGAPSAAGGRKKPGLTLSQMNGGDSSSNAAPGGPSSGGPPQSLMDKYSEYIDKETGTLRFKGKATINSEGVQFSSGTSFNISLDEVDTLDELGKGNYGTVYKVRHSRPRMRRPGTGLAGNKAQGHAAACNAISPASPTRKQGEGDTSPIALKTPVSGTGIVMAMKEIRLELDDAKFAAIIMELDILHRCISPYIVDFYGAFFQEGAVYICLEFMDGGSIDKLYLDGIPENVLRKITLATTIGLKFLKDKHNIIHRDVKPTNILINTKGQVKICDFGVSGNLVASIAKTNIGCQSYMAPERISSGGIAQAGANPGGGTYSVQSDIWSLGLTIIECAMGQYPYPPETYNNIFSQLSAIVEGEPPDLPKEGFSDAARDFVRGCLNKIPKLRPTYGMLLQHGWLAPLLKPESIVEEDEEEASGTANAADDDDSASAGSLGSAGSDNLQNSVVDREVADWVKDVIDKKKRGVLGKDKKAMKPALHAAPLDAVSSPGKEEEKAVSTGEPRAAPPLKQLASAP